MTTTDKGWQYVPVEPTRAQIERLATLWGYTVEEAMGVYSLIIDVVGVAEPKPEPSADMVKRANEKAGEWSELSTSARRDLASQFIAFAQEIAGEAVEEEREACARLVEGYGFYQADFGEPAPGKTFSGITTIDNRRGNEPELAVAIRARKGASNGQ